MRNILIISIILTTCTLTAYGQQPHEYADSTATTSASPKTGFIDKIVRYFSESNKRSDKAFDFSIIGGPHYSSDTKFGIGLVAAGLYRHNRTDTTIQPSNVSFYGDVSTVGFYLGGIRGSHIFPADRFRLNYKVYFYSFPTHMGENSDNDTKYKRLQSKAEATFLCRLAPNIYIGPSASFQYVDARQVDHPDLWEGQALKTTNFSLGLEFSYDSRDFIANASKGVYICMSQHFYPRFLGNRKYNFSLPDTWPVHLRPHPMGSPFDPRRQRIDARILRWALPRHERRRHHTGTTPENIPPQRGCSMDRRRQRIPIPQTVPLGTYAAKLRDRLPLGIQTTNERTSRPRFRASHNRIRIQHQ